MKIDVRGNKVTQICFFNFYAYTTSMPVPLKHLAFVYITEAVSYYCKWLRFIRRTWVSRNSTVEYHHQHSWLVWLLVGFSSMVDLDLQAVVWYNTVTIPFLLPSLKFTDSESEIRISQAVRFSIRCIFLK